MAGEPGRRRRGGGWVVLLAGALVVVACGEQSRLDHDEPVAVRGRALGVDGTPLAGRPIRLGTSASGADVGLGILTVGLSCIGGGCQGDAFDTTSDDDGAFRFDLTGGDLQSRFGEASSVLVSTSAAPPARTAAGPSVSAQLRVQSVDLVLPDLRLVDVAPALAATEEGSVQASWDGAAAPGPYTLTYLTAAGETVWEATTSDTTAAIDGRVLEDAVGVVTVATSRTDAVEGSDLTIVNRSAGIGFHGGYGSPPSRGAACEAHGEAGAVAPVQGCPLTDGRLARAAIPASVCPPDSGGTAGTAAACERLARVRVLLSRPIAAELLVVRGCADPCRVEVVDEAGAARDLGAVSAPFGLIRLEERPITAVDLIATDWSAFAEVSVWPRTPVVDALLEVDHPAAVLDLSDDDPSRTLPVAAAVVALLAAGVLAGTALARRRG